MTITARYRSSCRRCHQLITPGTTIEWDRDTRTSQHVTCPEAAAETAPTARPTASAASRTYRCRRCGETGRGGSYPFSTLPGSGYCDDCL